MKVRTSFGECSPASRRRLNAFGKGRYGAVISKLRCSSDEAWPLRVEAPAGNQLLHRGRVVARAETLLAVERMRGIDRGHVELDTEPGRGRHLHLAVDDLERPSGQRLAVLPDPVRIDRGDAAGRRGGDVREHRERDVEVVVRVRAPRQAP